MKYLLLVLLAVQLQALTLFHITAAEIYGLSIEKYSVVILSGKGIQNHALLQKHIDNLYICHSDKCVLDIINKYQYKYRTNGIVLITY